jgi:hypothetical protein
MEIAQISVAGQFRQDSLRPAGNATPALRTYLACQDDHQIFNRLDYISRTRPASPASHGALLASVEGPAAPAQACQEFSHRRFVVTVPAFHHHLGGAPSAPGAPDAADRTADIAARFDGIRSTPAQLPSSPLQANGRSQLQPGEHASVRCGQLLVMSQQSQHLDHSPAFQNLMDEVVLRTEAPRLGAFQITHELLESRRMAERV